MVMKAGGYYGLVFKDSSGVMQLDLLYSTIFNVAVDVVVWNWVTVMAESAEEWDGCRQEFRHQNALFYADNGIITSSDLQWLQGAFSILVGLFNRVGLKNNDGKTFVMIFRPCRAAGNQ